MLWGRAELTVQTDLGTWRTPDWLDIDRLLVDLLREYEDGLCPGCGEPMTSHAGRTYKDYASIAVTCPALIALDRAQAEQARRDGNREASTSPERARTWLKGSRPAIRAYSDYMKALLRGEPHG